MSKLPTGTFYNSAGILLGGLAGLLIQQVVPSSFTGIMNQTAALGLLVIGINMATRLQDDGWLLLLFTLLLGGIIGEWMGVKALLETCEGWARENLFLRRPSFGEGLVAAFVLFAASPITVVGAIEEGIQGKRDLLYFKSGIDAIAALALASSYGVGVLFSIIPLLIVQGGLTLLGRYAKNFFKKNLIAQLSAVGGVLLVALALKILVKPDLAVANLLPVLLVAPLVTGLYNRLGLKF